MSAAPGRPKLARTAVRSTKVFLMSAAHTYSCAPLCFGFRPSADL